MTAGAFAKVLAAPLARVLRAEWTLMWLIALFVVGFVAVIGVTWLFAELIEELNRKGGNERARLFIGEEIVRGIGGIETDFYRLATNTNRHAQERLHRQLREKADKLEHDLAVLKDGGKVTQRIALNVENADEMVRTADYQPDRNTQGYVLELIEIGPYLEQIRVKAEELRGMLLRREAARERNDARALLAAEREIKAYFRLLPSVFFRLNENANRLFFESNARLRDIEAQLARERSRYRQGEAVLIALVILFVTGIGALVARQIGATNRQLRAARDLAEHANAAKSQFLANMSHEIRTPLHGVLGFADLLERSALDATQRQQVALIQQSGQHLLELINDILDLAKIESGRFALVVSPLDLLQETDAVAREFAAQARDKGLVLVIEQASELPPVLGDSLRVRQILMNLIGNAIKFTDVGEITVRIDALTAEDGEAEARVTVVDTGIGIEAGKLKQIFEAFAQADDSTSRHYGGTGLGLAIANNLVWMMGGTIGVDSQPGQGSRFWFTLPFAPATPLPQEIVPFRRVVDARHGAPAAVGEGRDAGAALAVAQRGCILLAEDNEVNQLVASQMLAAAGFAVDVFATGEEVLAAVQARRYDAVLMDCQMPGIDGFEATRRIRRLEAEGKFDRLPVVALTANAFESDRQACFAAGMDQFVAKPFSREALLAAVDAAIADRRSVARADMSDPLPAGMGDAAISPAAIDVLRTLGGEAMVSKAIGIFLKSLKERCAAIDGALLHGDAAAVERHAHTLKSGCAYVGAIRLQAICAAMETAARDGDLERLRRMVGDCQAESAIVASALHGACAETEEST